MKYDDPIEIGFSLGSNLGESIDHLREAKRRILACPDTEWRAQSRLYETEPVGVKPEYAHLTFINAVLIVATPHAATQWLEWLQAIEATMGRRRGDDRNAPRAIDVDILFAGADCIDSGGLVVPHPRWAKRRFVVEPLAEIRPGLVLPGAGQTVAAIAAALEGEAVKSLTVEW